MKIKLFNRYNFLFFLVIISDCFCGNTSPVDTASLQPDMLVNNFTTSSYENGVLTWEITAKESSYYYNENRSIAKEILLKYYEDNKISTTVRADTAIITIDSNDIELLGNVDMVSTSGNRLQTSGIKWNDKNKMLDTDEKVKIIKKNGDVIEGTGMKADYKLESYEIKRNAVAITKSAGREKTEKK